MTTENSSQETNTTTGTQTENQTSTQDTSVQTASDKEVSATSQASESAAPTYTPNYKFKAAGKDYEVEEWLRPVIKDADSEAKLRKLYEKAYGLDDVKSRYDNDRKEWKQKADHYGQIDRTLNQLGTFLEGKDYDNFFEKLNVSFEDVAKWVSKKIDVMNLPAEQRAEIDQQNQIRQQNYMLSQQNKMLEQSYQQQMIQARTLELDSTLARPDIAQYATSWDTKMEQPGAFRQLVIDTAATLSNSTGKDLSVSEAIQTVMDRFGKLMSTQNIANSAEGQNVTGARKEVPVIPHVSGKGISPVKKTIKSLDDIKQLAKSLD